jgi:hypothetical protein
VGQAVWASVVFAIKNKLLKAMDAMARGLKPLNIVFILISLNHRFWRIKIPMKKAAGHGSGGSCITEAVT